VPLHRGGAVACGTSRRGPVYRRKIDMRWMTALLRTVTAPPPSDAAVLSRRALLSGGFLKRPSASPSTPESQSRRQAFPVLRPPGAIAEATFLAGCTRCGDCIRVCPHQAIRLAPERLRVAAGTPIIDPAEQPCLMCVDTPCITACSPGVLKRPASAAVPRIGVARISTVDCLAHQGTTCSSCSERCPVEGAIKLTRGRPQVVAEACTGCGICQHVCPAPRNAVLVMPLDRP